MHATCIVCFAHACILIFHSLSDYYCTYCYVMYTLYAAYFLFITGHGYAVVYVYRLGTKEESTDKDN